MKSYVLVTALLCFISVLAFGGCGGNSQHESKKLEADTLKKRNVLYEYEVDPCIFNLLYSIHRSNMKFYKNDQFFYSLIFKKTNGNRRMTIEARLWDSPGEQTFLGVVRVGNASFLLSGDIAAGDFFRVKKSSKIETNLKYKGTEFYSGYMEPILSGKYIDCPDKPFYLEVYTKGKIEKN